MSKFLSLSWTDIKSILVTGFIGAFLAVGGEIATTKDVFTLDYRTLLNTGIISAFTMIVASVQALFTTKTGQFAGAIKVK